jgi:hypothetical protein
MLLAYYITSLLLLGLDCKSRPIVLRLATLGHALRTTILAQLAGLVAQSAEKNYNGPV